MAMEIEIMRWAVVVVAHFLVSSRSSCIPAAPAPEDAYYTRG